MKLDISAKNINTDDKIKTINVINGANDLKNRGYTHKTHRNDNSKNVTAFIASLFLYFSQPHAIPQIVIPKNIKLIAHKKYIIPNERAPLGKM